MRRVVLDLVVVVDIELEIVVIDIDDSNELDILNIEVRIIIRYYL